MNPCVSQTHHRRMTETNGNHREYHTDLLPQKPTQCSRLFECWRVNLQLKPKSGFLMACYSLTSTRMVDNLRLQKGRWHLKSNVCKVECQHGAWRWKNDTRVEMSDSKQTHIWNLCIWCVWLDLIWHLMGLKSLTQTSQKKLKSLMCICIQPVAAISGIFQDRAWRWSQSRRSAHRPAGPVV